MNGDATTPIEFARLWLDEDEIVLYLSTYVRSHTPAVFATCVSAGDFEEPYGNLTVNLSQQGLVLPPWHISVKTWAENEGLARACQASEVFEPTEQSWALPFGSTAPIWRLAGERLPAAVAAQISQLMDWPLGADQPQAPVGSVARPRGGA